MAGTPNCGANEAQNTGMTMSVCTFFSCKHSEISIVPYTPTTVSTNPRSVEGPCNAPACKQKFAGRIRSEIQLATMNCESCLRKFSMVEPMLAEELTAAGYSSALVEALVNCTQRSAATAKYLGHQGVLFNLGNYERCTDASQAQALAAHLIATNKIVQHRLLAMQSSVLRLSTNFFPAPGHAFPMLAGITSYERHWGRTELAALKSTPEGLSILALPLASENILRAKTSILRAQTELATLQASERASFFADYPGTEALFASGAMKSTQQRLAETDSQDSVLQGVSKMAIDAADDDAEQLVDIRCLRAQRVGSKKMAANALGIDMGAVRAYSGKPYTDLTNPWWAAKAA